MKKILLITLGSRGDINPFLCIGKALRQYNHEITIISSEIYQDLVRSENLNFISCGTAAEYEAVINAPEFYDLRKSFNVVAKYIFLNSMRKIYDIIAQFDPANTILVATPFMLGARLANEKLNFPLISICLHPMSLWSEVQPPIYPGASFEKLPRFLTKFLLRMADKWVLDKAFAKELNQFREELGLSKVNKISSVWMYSPQKVLGIFPEWFASYATDWPKNTELAGFLQYNEKDDLLLPAAVKNFLENGKPPIILTYGTAVAQYAKFFKIFIEAARILGERLLILTQYKQQLPELKSTHEMHVSYLPLQKLLPLAAAIIHHGGIGTLSQAVAAATPQLIVPLAHDQFDNAFRIEKMAAGLAITSKHYSVKDAVNKIQELLGSTKIKNNCLLYAKKMDSQLAEQRICNIVNSF